MRIEIVTPAPAGSLLGNRVTARRWARLLRELGHTVRITNEYSGSACDVLIALHARKSSPSVRRFREEYPDRPLVVGLTGTDLYEDLPSSTDAAESLKAATRIVTLQPLACQRLSERLRPKCRPIIQSAESIPRKESPLKGVFEICVLGHLREVKDPLRAAEASRLLPPESKIRITHAGRALDPQWVEKARRDQRENTRYCWRGGATHSR